MSLPIPSLVEGLGGPTPAGLGLAGAPSAPPATPAPPPAWARLVVAVGRARGQSIPLRGPRFVIGRDPTCQLRPHSPTISRYHTALEFRGGRVFVHDLGGANGTVLNGRTLRGDSAEAADGARLRVGPLRFVVRAVVRSEDVIAGWLSEGDGRADGEVAAATAGPVEPAAGAEDWLASLLSDDAAAADPRAATLLEVSSAPVPADPDAPIPVTDLDEGWLASAFSPADDLAVVDAPAPAPTPAATDDLIALDEGWLSSLLSDDAAAADPRAATLLEVPSAPAPAATDDPWGGDEGWLASALSPDGDEVALAPLPSAHDDREGRPEGATPVRDLDDAERRLEDWVVTTLDGFESTSESGRLASRSGALPTVGRARSLPSRLKHREPEDPGQTRVRVIESRGVTVALLQNREILTDKDTRETDSELRNLVAAGLTCVILDFGAVERCSTQFLGAVASLSEACKAEGGLLKVCSLRPELVGLIASTGLNRKIRVDPDQPTAFANDWPNRPPTTLVVEVLSEVKGLNGPRAAGPGFVSAPAARRRPSAPAPAPARVQAPARLVVAGGRARGQTIAIRGPRFVIGRDPTCQLRPSSPTISRYHTALEVRGGRVFVHDLGGANGTVLNGRALRGESAEAADGARLRVGPLRFVVRAGVGSDDVVAGWVNEGDGRADDGTEDGTEAAGGYAAATAGPDEPDLETVEVETGVSDIECRVIMDVLVVTVKLPALADESAVAQLRAALTHIHQRSPVRRVVVSLCNVAVLSRPAMGVLVAHMLRLEWEGGGLRLCHILTPVMAVLKKIHLPSLIETHPSLDDAVLTNWP